MPYDLARKAGIRHALKKLDDDFIAPDDLLSIGQEAQACARELLARQELISSFLEARPLDTAINVLVWGVGIAGFLAACKDFGEKGELSGWGMIDLAAGLIGLFLSAWIYQRKAWERDDYAAKLANIRETLNLLVVIMDRVNARVSS